VVNEVGQHHSLSPKIQVFLGVVKVKLFFNFDHQHRQIHNLKLNYMMVRFLMVKLIQLG
jgi:hypothetical protein